MFKVEQWNRGYRISTSDGRLAFATDLTAIHLALNHYYGPAHYPSKPESGCPFCIQAVANERAGGLDRALGGE